MFRFSKYFSENLNLLIKCVAELTTIDPAGARHSSSELGLLSLLQRCSVAVLKTRFTRMSGKAEAKIGYTKVKN